jgi:hypothetical protein
MISNETMISHDCSPLPVYRLSIAVNPGQRLQFAAPIRRKEGCTVSAPTYWHHMPFVIFLASFNKWEPACVY